MFVIRVSLDVDGVLADFVLSFTRVAYQLRWLAPSPFKEGIEIYRTNEQEHWKFKWPDDFYNEVWNDIDQSYNWWMGLEPLVNQEEINAINFIIRNHDVYFLTSRKRTLGYPACKQTSLWLDSIGINSNHAVTIATQPGKKHQLVNALDIDAHIDDRPDVIDKIRNHSQAISCRKTWQYNTDCKPNIDFDSVKDFCQWITEYSRGLEVS